MIFRKKHDIGSAFLPATFAYINIIPGPNNIWAVRKDEVIRDTEDTPSHNVLYEEGAFGIISSRYSELIEELKADPSFFECETDETYVTLTFPHGLRLPRPTFVDISVVTVPACTP